MRKIFIDCGGHVGESITLFKKLKEYTPDFEIFSFEPVPALAQNYKHWKGITHFQKAVWIIDGEIEFYLAKSDVGNSMFKGKRTGGMDKEHPIIVECIDFSKWILNSFSEEDHVVLKMDIEGAEFKVLDKMIKDGSIDYINTAYVEWHSAFDDFPDKDIYDDLLKRLGNTGVQLYNKEMAKVHPRKNRRK